MRKVIQLVMSNDDTVALCDDGSMWVFDDNFNKWRRLPDIPQDSPQEAHLDAIRKGQQSC